MNMKKMRKANYGGSGFVTSAKVPKAGSGQGPKGFTMSNSSSVNMGAGSKPGASGKANGTRRGGGGRSY